MGTKAFRAIRIVLPLIFLNRFSGEHVGTFLIGLCLRVEIRARRVYACSNWVAHLKPLFKAVSPTVTLIRSVRELELLTSSPHLSFYGGEQYCSESSFFCTIFGFKRRALVFPALVFSWRHYIKLMLLFL